MSSTIQDLKENESYVLRLLNSQTSVVNSTINIIKQGLLSTKQSFAQIHWEINAINKSLHYIDDGLYQIRLTQLFNAGIMQLSLIANNLQRTKSSILDALTDTHHGKVSPLLLTPTQLEKEINQIKHHLPQKTDLPVPMKDILELYKLMRIKGGITKQHVLFSITLPLVDQIKFDIYNLIPIPNWINDSMVMIDPCDSMLAINIEREQYFLVSTLLLKSCDAIRSDVFLCYNIQLRYHFGAETCSCEINLFNNNTLPTCTLKTIRTNVTWIPLAHQNQWIYTAASSTQATAVCDKEIIPLNLEGSGLLKIKPECILKHDFIHVAGQRLITTTLNHSYSSLGKFRELSTGKFTKNPMYLDKNLPVFSENYAAQMKELTNLQQKIQMQTEHPLQYHSQHGIAVSYAALLTSISAITVILIIYVSYKKSRQYLVSNMLQQNPSVIHTHEDNVQGAPSPLPRICSPDRAPASAGEDV